MNFINLTGKKIKLNDGTIYKPCDIIAKVEYEYKEMDKNHIANFNVNVSNVPSPKDDFIYIVTKDVAIALQHRDDIVYPAYSHPNCIKNAKGRILSIPGFIKII